MNEYVSIVDCGHGNLLSVANALRRLGVDCTLVESPAQVRNARRLVFPGQGAAPSAIRSMEATGMDSALHSAIEQGVPTLGICLGMQLALERSQEGPTQCLGLVPGVVRRFDLSPESPKVPLIGWNRVDHDSNALFQNIPNGTYFYFVHSYFCETTSSHSIAWAEYGVRYSAALQKDNFWATQFHPEKSGRFGLQLLSNFLGMSS